MRGEKIRGYLVCDRVRMRSPAELEGCLHALRANGGGAYAPLHPPGYGPALHTDSRLGFQQTPVLFLSVCMGSLWCHFLSLTYIFCIA